MTARRPWWLGGATARGGFLLGGVYLVTGLLFLSKGLLAHSGYWVWLAVAWLFFSAVGFTLGIARRRWERSHPDSDSR